ncbi:MAG: OprO/OprP family phosphate-selective porin [Bacteroidales bacterium]|nr:OprO/OprP family phosphate-selective porin [Bacteroidales bacterium]
MDLTKLLCVGGLLIGAALPASADDDVEFKARSLSVDIDMRGDFEYTDMEHQDNTSGFHGRYLNLMVNGQITEQLSFSWRQRMNKFKDVDNDAFTATDWAYLSYRPVQAFSIAAGKQVVMIGGYEYDAAPIDIFFASRFWNNIACYQFGGSVSYHSPGDNHVLTFQVCNSPYEGLSSSCYSYNLFWQGDMGWFHTLWSVNLVEYERNHYANFIALGNRATLGPLDLQLDLMNRATSHHKYWFADYSIIAKAEFNATKWLTIMAKGGKDDFRELPGAPEHLNKPFVGGGLEFYPFNGSRNLRIHAVYAYYHENDGAKVNQVQVGLKWRVNLFRKAFQ